MLRALRIFELVEVDLAEPAAQLDPACRTDLIDLLLEDLGEDLPVARLFREALGIGLRLFVGALLGERAASGGERELGLTEPLLLDVDDPKEQLLSRLDLFGRLEAAVEELDEL